MLLIVLTLLALYHAPGGRSKHKNWIFLAMAIPVAIATIYLVSITIYINVNSETLGPVHWHADFELWQCDERMIPFSRMTGSFLIRCEKMTP